MKVYLAGKVQGADWRSDLVHGLGFACDRDSWHHRQWLECEGEEWIPLRSAVIGGHDYMGPFPTVVGCDMQHGDMSTYTFDDGLHGMNDSISSLNLSHSHELTLMPMIWRSCTEAIRNSDFVFAYITDFDCFGTIHEIGFANALGIPVFVHMPTKIDEEGYSCRPPWEEDLWFPFGGCSVTASSEPPATAFNNILVSQWSRNRIEQSIARRNEKKSSQHAVKTSINRVICDAEGIAQKGSAAWRDLIRFVVTDPLREALAKFK